MGLIFRYDSFFNLVTISDKRRTERYNRFNRAYADIVRADACVDAHALAIFHQT